MINKTIALISILFLGTVLYLMYSSFIGIKSPILQNTEIKDQGLRDKTLLARKKVEIAFDNLKNETVILIDNLENTKDYFEEKFHSLDTIKNRNYNDVGKLSNEIDKSICKANEKKISILHSKVIDIEDAASIYFTLIDSLVDRIKESPRLFNTVIVEIDTIKEEYNKALEKANYSILSASVKLKEICYYREVIIIMTTIVAVREKIGELNNITQEAIDLIKELDNFAYIGKNIIINIEDE